MKILVTGSAGHLGEALMRTLRDHGNSVVGIDLLPSPFTDVVGDIANRKLVDECMRGVTHVLHTATLHKPHVATHARQVFVDTNVTGTLNLLEAAVANKVKAFVFTSTTSTFGEALTPPPGSPAAWITEDVVPIPKNIYGVTKTAAEDLCRLFHRNAKLPCLVLRTSRFFPEEDDVAERASAYEEANLKVNELLYRRVDVEDVVSSLLLAMEKAPALGFGKFIITATTPFQREDLAQLGTNAPAVLAKYFPEYPEIYARLGWKMLPTLDRVYVNARARELLGWRPEYDFAHALRCVAAGKDYRSPITSSIGSKGYHRVA
ncbi:MAG: 3 beta-hydroxysteroid dehydrogenase/Delta 5--_4-isomerase [Steroidobacteraceae bacterium]|nr:3 beta-hydroxysteroid dehydrogenase/Delta 5-->4-isomerase [Steroidobacteraceae bacterium]